jgi:hypothetical protein
MKKLVNGELIECSIEEAHDIAAEWESRRTSLDDIRAVAKAAIDVAAGRARARYITVAPGQEAVYVLKAAEADAGGGPILAAEAKARGITLDEMAALVRDTRDRWIAIAAQIEAIRASGKLAVDAAESHAAVDAARDEALARLREV